MRSLCESFIIIIFSFVNCHQIVDKIWSWESYKILKCFVIAINKMTKVLIFSSNLKGRECHFP